MASKSLGTLTLDLVAKTGGFVQGMSKAERESKKWRKQVEKDMQKVSKAAKVGLIAVSGAALGAGAALTKMAADGLKNVDAQNKLARSLDTSYDSITALNIAFSEGGVDGYEASLNRMNRRLGAAEKGTGAAAKTVEALNLNLAELAGLDVDERVASIADSIQESGASSAQAARYVQDLGFEQKQANQFFAQGGDAIRGYRKQVDQFGLSVSEIDAVKVEQANDEFAKIGRLLEGVSTQIAVQVAPILSAASQLFVQNAKDAGGIGEATASSFNIVVDSVAAGVDALAILDRGFLKSQNAVDVFALSVRIGLLEVAREIVEIPTAAVNEMIMLVNAIPGVDIDLFGLSTFGRAIQGTIDDTKEEISGLNSALKAEFSKPLPGTQFKRLVFEAREAANDSAEATIAAQKKIKDALGNGGGGVIPGSDQDKLNKDLASRLKSITQSFETEKQAILRVYGERDSEITALEETRTLTQMQAQDLRYQNEVDKIEKLAEMRKKNEEEELAYWDKWLESAKDNLQNFEELSKTVIDNFTTGFGSAFESIIFDSETLDDALKGIAETILRGVVNSIGQMAAQWLALQAVQAALSAASTAQTVAEAATVAAAWAPAAAGASLATVGTNSVPAIAGISAVSAIASSSLLGMSHDGTEYIPKTGSWFLEEGQRVVTSDTSAKLDATLERVAKSQGGGGGAPVVNITENPNKAGEVSARQNDDGQWVIDVVVADALNGGRAIRTQQSVFGLKRQGR